MERKIAKINGKMYDVIQPEEYTRNSDIYNSSHTALEYKNIGIFPIKNKIDIMNKEVGVYPTKDVNIMYTGTELPNEYSCDNIIDLNSRNMKEVLDKNEAIKSLENEILTNAENVYVPKIKNTDSPALQSLKTAVGLKHCDLDSYAYRFGPNFNNDIRHLKNQGNKSKISLDKLVSIADNLDMQVKLTIQDKSPDVPNPMGEEITTILNGAIENEEE